HFAAVRFLRPAFQRRARGFRRAVVLLERHAPLSGNLSIRRRSNFNLDSDRGYGYLCWDWLRFHPELSRSVPAGFKNQPDDVSRHTYPTPRQPGYGWDKNEVKP